MRQALNLIIYITVLILTLGCTGIGGKKPEREAVVSVRTIKVSSSSHVIGKNYMGTVEEEDGANVSFGVIGNVVRVMVEEGQFVRKGQALAEVDGQNVRSAHEISAATLNQAEDAYRRLKDLYDKGTLPEIKMVEMETALAKAKAAEAISRKSVSEIVLRAPFDGYVASIQPEATAEISESMTNEQLFLQISQAIISQQLYLQPLFDRETAATHFGISSRRIGTAFTQGSPYKSLPDFIRECRLKHACRLLRDSTMSIADIAAASGFSRTTTFNHDFKVKYELSPSEFRELQD